MGIDDKRMHSVCFSGHRNEKINLKIQTFLEICIHTRVTHGGGDFYAGGAVGWDAFCSKTVIDFKKKGFNMRLHLILPCCFDEQTKGWSEEEKQEHLEIQSYADTVEYISEHYTKDCKKRRNQKLVDSAGWLWCFDDEKRSRSGTGQTFRMAGRSGLRIRNFNI